MFFAAVGPRRTGSSGNLTFDRRAVRSLLSACHSNLTRLRQQSRVKQPETAFSDPPSLSARAHCSSPSCDTTGRAKTYLTKATEERTRCRRDRTRGRMNETKLRSCERAPSAARRGSGIRRFNFSPRTQKRGHEADLEPVSPGRALHRRRARGQTRSLGYVAPASRGGNERREDMRSGTPVS